MLDMAGIYWIFRNCPPLPSDRVSGAACRFSLPAVACYQFCCAGKKAGNAITRDSGGRIRRILTLMKLVLAVENMKGRILRGEPEPGRSGSASPSSLLVLLCRELPALTALLCPLSLPISRPPLRLGAAQYLDCCLRESRSHTN